MKYKKIRMILTTGLALTLIAAHAFAYGGIEIDIHGFISQGYLYTTENNFTTGSKDGTFQFNEIGINFGSELTDKLRIGTQLFSQDFGDTGNNEVKVDWAYADYHFRDFLGLRFGQIKVPHGIFNEYRDVDMLRNWIFLPQSVYPEILRDITLSLQGVSVYGNIYMDSLGGLSYQAGYGTQDIPYNDKTADLLIGIPTTMVDNDSFDVDTKYVASLAWDTPLRGLRLGVTYDSIQMKINQYFTMDLIIPPNPVNVDGLTIEEGTPAVVEFNKYENWVYSMEFIWLDLALTAEYIQTNKEYSLNALPEKPLFELHPSGWYVGGAYRFADWFELGGYYSEFENEYPLAAGEEQPDIPDYFSYLKDICVTTRFDINAYWTVKFEAHRFEGAFGLSPYDSALPSVDGDYKKSWNMFAAKLTVAY